MPRLFENRAIVRKHYQYEVAFEALSWNILDELINILLPLQECTDDLQRNGANVDTASTILTYLKQETAASATIGGLISTVFNKWIITNPIAHAIMYNEGTFYDYMCTDIPLIV